MEKKDTQGTLRRCKNSRLEIINKMPNPKFIEATIVIGVLNHIIIALEGAPNMLEAISFGIKIKTNNRIPTKICKIPIILSINSVFIII